MSSTAILLNKPFLLNSAEKMRLRNKQPAGYEIFSPADDSTLFYFTTDHDFAYQVRFKPSG